MIERLMHCTSCTPHGLPAKPKEPQPKSGNSSARITKSLETPTWKKVLTISSSCLSMYSCSCSHPEGFLLAISQPTHKQLNTCERAQHPHPATMQVVGVWLYRIAITLPSINIEPFSSKKQACSKYLPPSVAKLTSDSSTPPLEIRNLTNPSSL